MFLLKPENSAKKIKLSEYYNEIKGEKDNKMRFSSSTQEVFFEQNLAYLVKKSFDCKGITKTNFAEYITANPDRIYEFELPESEFNEEFMQFTNDYFNNLVGKCNVKFVIKNK